jgi:crotonobetainyl-CoA hydratase
MTAAPPVAVERDDAILWITLNRPAARNAVNLDVAALLAEALEQLKNDESLRVGVIRGAGAAFCAGQDLKAVAAGEPLFLPDHPEWGWAGFVGHDAGKPLIAAVHGYALGGGLELALACDLIVAGEDTRFALPEVTRGLFAAGGGVPRLAQQIPPKIAARYLLTGEFFSAAEAWEWGLVSELVPEDDVIEAARRLAERIAANAPLGVQATKTLLRTAGGRNLWEPRHWDDVREAVGRVFSSRDAAEGTAAFAEKREPVWTGS